MFIVKQNQSSCSYFSPFNPPATENGFPSATVQWHQSVGCFSHFKKWDEEESQHLLYLSSLGSSLFLMDIEIKYHFCIPTAANGSRHLDAFVPGQRWRWLISVLCSRHLCWLEGLKELLDWVLLTLQSSWGKGRHTGTGKTPERGCTSLWGSKQVVGAPHSHHFRLMALVFPWVWDSCLFPHSGEGALSPTSKQ